MCLLTVHSNLTTIAEKRGNTLNDFYSFEGEMTLHLRGIFVPRESASQSPGIFVPPKMPKMETKMPF
jgi:hypothetical protein